MDDGNLDGTVVWHDTLSKIKIKNNNKNVG